MSASVMQRFSNMKLLLESIDKLVFGELTKKVDRLSRLTARSDAMLAVYPGGKSRFQRHIDNTANDGRRLTVLCYLNECGWKEEDGGMLRVWKIAAEDEIENNSKQTTSSSSKTTSTNDGSCNGSESLPAVDVLPEGGRIALFYSDKVPHEVTATNSNRYALTVWYYDGIERSEAVAKSKELQR